MFKLDQFSSSSQGYWRKRLYDVSAHKIKMLANNGIKYKIIDHVAET